MDVSLEGHQGHKCCIHHFHPVSLTQPQRKLSLESIESNASANQHSILPLYSHLYLLADITRGQHDTAIFFTSKTNGLYLAGCLVCHGK